MPRPHPAPAPPRDPRAAGAAAASSPAAIVLVGIVAAAAAAFAVLARSPEPVATESIALPAIRAGAAGVDPDRDPEAIRPGWLARYVDLDTPGASIERIDDAINFDWTEDAPDPRIGADRFEVAWSGRIEPRDPGPFLFEVVARGAFRLVIDGVERLRGDSPDVEERWTSPPIGAAGRFDPIEVRLEYRKTGPRARIGLFWRTDRRALEAPRRDVVGHASPHEADSDADRARTLTRNARCDACHARPGWPDPIPGPALARAADRWRDAETLADWLAGDDQRPGHGGMPDFGLAPDAARNLARVLMAESDPIEKIPPSPDSMRPVGDPDRGRGLFRELACVACHGESEPTRVPAIARPPGVGGPLAPRLARRPAGYVRAWLADPDALDPDHRMPAPDLTAAQIEDLAAYLQPDPVGIAPPPPNREPEPEPDPEAAVALIADLRCRACHVLPERLASPPRPVAIAFAIPRGENPGCLADPDPDTQRPGYRLSDDDRALLRAELDRPAPRRESARLAASERGRWALEERGCLACHARGSSGGLLAALAPGVSRDNDENEEDPEALAARIEATRKLRATIVPPTLDGVGDKLTDLAIRDALRNASQAPRRPWLSARMPRFALDDDEADALVAHLAASDRLPENANLARDLERDVLPPARAQTLVSSRGFGCISCHGLGFHEPRETAPGARGPNLSDAASRFRADWFVRWCRDPARMAPGTEMPGLSVPAPNLLGEDVDRQIRALWNALADPTFTAPPERAVSRSFRVEPNATRAIVLRDVHRFAPDPEPASKPGSGSSGGGAPAFPSPWVVRAFAAAFPNGACALIDLDVTAMRALWTAAPGAPFAQQINEGKTWFVEPTARPPGGADGPSIVPLVAVRARGDSEWSPARPEANGPGALVAHAHEPGGAVRLDLDLVDARGEPVAVRLTLAPGEGRGALRIEAALRPDVERPYPGEIALALPPAGGFVPGADAALDGRSVRVVFPPSATIAMPIDDAAVVESKDGDDEDGANRLPIAKDAGEFPAGPGLIGRRIPIDPDHLPTALAFDPAGRLLVASLRGDLLRRGADGNFEAFADPLAAPFGMLPDPSDPRALFVAHKPELLRLVDTDGDGFHETAEVVASGWGYTEDYHDWTVGPVRDAEGALYVALGSDYSQPRRPLEAGRWRGHALRIDPRLPRGRRVESWASGLRFSHGLAITSDGAILASDNQGDRNPFNEIVHLERGTRHGVPSRLDDPNAPTTPAAVNLPHPRTRSVNGLAIVPPNPPDPAFAPFAGQILGCEYNNRGLIRVEFDGRAPGISQGTAFPFTPLEDGPVRVGGSGAGGMIGPIAAAFDPATGALIVGGMREAGWGGGSNRGELIELRGGGKPPSNGPRSIRAIADADGSGLRVEWLADIPDGPDADPLARVAAARSYRREWAGSYASPDLDARAETPASWTWEPGSRRAGILRFREPIREGFVYELRFAAPAGETWFPDEAFATIHQVPRSSVGR